MGSVNDAARALSLRPASALMHMRALEKDLGVDLYERGHRGNVVLTQAGTILRGHAISILRETDEAQQQIYGLKESASGSLRIGANITGGMYVLPEIVRNYTRLVPDIQIVPTFESTPKLMDLLLHDLLDVALTGGPIDNGRFEIRSVGPDELVLIASPDHQLALQGHARLGDLASETLVLAGVGSRSRWLLESSLDHAGLRIRKAITMNGTEDVKRAVMANVGLGFVSMYSVLCEVTAGSLVLVVIPGFRIKRNLELFWRKERNLIRMLGPLEQVARETVGTLEKKAIEIFPNII